MHAAGQAININEGPEGLGRADPAEEQHGTGLVNAVEDSPFLVHPKGDDVALVGKFLGQRLGPEATLRHQVRTSVLGKVVWVYSGGVFSGEAQTQSPTPAALLFGNLQRRKLVGT